MTTPISLIVGLGNPGTEYAKTRHNVGFWFLDDLVNEYLGHFQAQSKFYGETARIQIDGQEVWCLKPSTFMNRSGQSVQALAAFYRIPISEILVVHDELDLDPGIVRLKQSGGHGGHNGLRDITNRFNTGEYQRLRIGIGHPSQQGGGKSDVSKYVLNRPPNNEESDILDALTRARIHFKDIVQGHSQKVMNALHTK
jgi:PTH1 family peptidyl-tRNA hydrolase